MKTPKRFYVFTACKDGTCGGYTSMFGMTLATARKVAKLEKAKPYNGKVAIRERAD